MTSGVANKLVTTILSASVAGVLVAGLTACGGGSTAQEPQTPAPSASSEVTDPAVDRPAAPVMPDQAKQPTQAGAEAFLQYWWDVYTYSYQSGDTTLLASISDLESCNSCNGYVEEVNGMASKGEFAEGGAVRVVETELLGTSETPAYELNFEIQQEALQITNSAQEELRSQAARAGLRGDTLVVWQAQKWKIAYFTEEGIAR